MSNFDLKRELEQQQNVVEQLSKIVIDKCWSADEMDSGIRYELAGLAGGIHFTAKNMLELIEQIDFTRDNLSS